MGQKIGGPEPSGRSAHVIVPATTIEREKWAVERVARVRWAAGRYRSERGQNSTMSVV